MTTGTTGIGTHIGPYRVIRELGAGGMGRVYLAVSRSGRAVAVKVVRPGLAGDPSFRRRFADEVAAARAVSGAFTTPVVDADPDGPQPWLATAYVPGPSLRDAIDTYGPMPEPTVRVLAAGLAEALVAIHGAGLIHRDLKPSNILLAADGPRVIDFGISKPVDTTSVTQDGELIGSFGYVSPEHATGGYLTPASDVFSLGAVVTFAATGQPPFGTGPVDVLIYRTIHEQPRLDDVPPALAQIVTTCLDKDPARRPTAAVLPGWLQAGPATPGWLGAVTDELGRREQSVAAAVRTPLLKRRSVLIGGAALIAAAAGGTALLWPKPVSLPRLDWTAALPGSDFRVAAASNSTVVCTNPTGVASFDRASGRALWRDAVAATALRTDGGRVYAVQTDGHLHAVDPRTGRNLWTSTASGNAPDLQVITPSTIVAVDSSGDYYGINTADGSKRWSYPRTSGDGDWADSPTGTGRVVLAGGDGDTPNSQLTVYTVVSLDKGTTEWSKTLTELAATTTGLWYGLDDKLNLLGLDPATGAQHWRRATQLPTGGAGALTYTGSLQLEQDTVICQPFAGGRTPGVLAAFDAVDGHRLWSVSVPSDAVGYAVTGRTLCYVDGSVRAVNSLHAVDLRTGDPLWTSAAGLGKTTLLGSVNGMILTGVDDSKGQGGLYGWDARSGKQQWHFPVQGGSGSWFIAELPPDGLFATYSGKLFAFRGALS